MSIASRLTDLVDGLIVALNARNAPGPSDYQMWLAAGNTGTLADYRTAMLGGDNDYAAQFQAALGAIPPSGAASEAQAGVTQLATDAEALAGTVSTKAVSPKGLRNTSLRSVRGIPTSPSTQGNTQVWIRLATVSGIDDNNGGNVTLLIAGLGSIGRPDRATAIVTMIQRGGGVNGTKGRAMWLSGPVDSAAFYTKQISPYVIELWVALPPYSFAPTVTLLDSYNAGATVLADSFQLTDPGGLVAIDNKETDWSLPTGIIPWDSGFFENSVRRVPNGLEINMGVKKSDGTAFTVGQKLFSLGSTLKPGVYGNGQQIAIPAYSTAGPGWSVAPGNGNITTDGIYFSGSAVPVHGLFGTFRTNGYGVN